MNDKDLEILSLLQEECAEVIQIISKIRRFGFESRNPYIADATDNRALLEHELGDVCLLIDVLIERRLVTKSFIDHRIENKRIKLIEMNVLEERNNSNEN